MKTLERALTALCFFLLTALPCQASRAAFPTWHGVNLIVTHGKNYDAQFDVLRELGANAVALVVLCVQHSTTLTCPNEPPRAELEGWVREARARGLRVMVKPHVETREFSWRGEIRFKTEAEWDAWFEQYARIVLRLAEVDADAFAVGTELAGMTEREAEWRKVIALVRTVFRGYVLYAAHFEEFERVNWWDALDVIGVDAYFPLQISGNKQLTTDALIAAWQPYRVRLEQMARKTGKPLVFTEIGYQSRRHAFETPWQKDPALRDERAQAFAYEAVFEVFADARWWYGALWWDWSVGDANPADDPNGVTGFTPTLKPAEGVLLAHWRARQRAVR